MCRWRLVEGGAREPEASLAFALQLAGTLGGMERLRRYLLGLTAMLTSFWALERFCVQDSAAQGSAIVGANPLLGLK